MIKKKIANSVINHERGLLALGNDGGRTSLAHREAKWSWRVRVCHRPQHLVEALVLVTDQPRSEHESHRTHQIQRLSRRIRKVNVVP
jgi:hypothetical protein